MMEWLAVRQGATSRPEARYLALDAWYCQQAPIRHRKLSSYAQDRVVATQEVSH